MEKLIDKLEFGNIKLLRKNLIVSSATAIFISQLVKYSEDSIKFLVFTIPENNKYILNKLMWWIVLYFLIALAIRMFSEEFPEWYRNKAQSLRDYPRYTPPPPPDDEMGDNELLNHWKKNRIWLGLSKILVKGIDIHLPFALGIIALVASWSF